MARHHGYGRIGRTVPRPPHPGRLDDRQRERRRLRSLLVGRGLSEAMPLPFLAPGDLERCGLPGDGIRITNPLVAEESVLRTSLLPGLVKALATNAARRNTGVGLWEIGHVFRRWPEGTTGPGTELPDEREVLGVALGGRDATEAVREWYAIAELLSLQDATLRNGPVPGLHPTRSARILAASGEELGAVGEVDPAVLEAHGIGERVGWIELDLDAVARAPPSAARPVASRPATRPLRGRRVAGGGRRAVLRRPPATTWRRCGCSTSTGPGIAEGRRSSVAAPASTPRPPSPTRRACAPALHRGGRVGPAGVAAVDPRPRTRA